MPHIHVSAWDDLTPSQAHGLMKLRQDVFIVEQSCPYADLDGRDIEPGNRHLWVEENGLPVSTLRILQEPDDVARIGRVATALPHRGQGLSSCLVAHALEIIGERRSILDAQSHLAHFYARFGFRQRGDNFVEDDIDHTPMQRP